MPRGWRGELKPCARAVVSLFRSFGEFRGRRSVAPRLHLSIRQVATPAAKRTTVS